MRSSPPNFSHPQDWQAFMEATRAFSHDPSEANARRLAAATGKLSRLRAGPERVKQEEKERSEPWVA